MTLRLIYGVDPGVSGALAVLADDKFDSVHDLPTRLRKTGRQELDGKALADLLRTIRARHPGAAEVFVLEEVNAMPSFGKPGEPRRGMGATSAFQFGRGVGTLEGVVETLGIPLVHVVPAKWKRDMGLKGCPKDDARTMAISMYPDAADHLKRKKDIGRSEAILLAKWGFNTEAWVTQPELVT